MSMRLTEDQLSQIARAVNELANLNVGDIRELELFGHRVFLEREVAGSPGADGASKRRYLVVGISNNVRPSVHRENTTVSVNPDPRIRGTVTS
jgi:hypothetical protein